jgi:glucokinase
MISESRWTIGVDLGGTKIDIARVDDSGQVRVRRRLATRAGEGPAAVEARIIEAVRELQQAADSPALGLGIGVAGQIDPISGVVRYAPNLNWRDVPLKAGLSRALELPVLITNDVRAATWGEWFHGAGQGCDDLICLFVGTGIGGGVVSGGQMLTGCSNTAGELGHITVDLHGPYCHCGNRGCFEALAGGWAIARNARDAISADPAGGALLLSKAEGNPEAVTAKMVTQAAGEGDPLAMKLMDDVALALIAGTVGLVNAFNPCRLIFGGGVIAGMPELTDRIGKGIHQRVLAAAGAPLQVLPSQLGNDAGVIGAALLAMRELSEKEVP